MPRFFFDDVIEDGVSAADQDGVLIDKLEDAEQEAAVVLAESVVNRMPGASRHDMQIVIRDQERKPIARLRLTFARKHLA
jgi:hypothetical protein